MNVIEVVFLVIFWTWAFCALLLLRNTWLPRLSITLTPQNFDLPFETVQFRATDGTLLEGWMIPADSARPWIILCHGVGSNRSDLLEIAAGLHAARLNIFLFDFRAHGGSAGRTTSFGWHEQRDLEGALAFLGQSPGVASAPYGVYGISMGGVVAILVGATDERIGAVAVDSPYTNLEDSLSQHAKLLYPMLPQVPCLWFVSATYRLRFGVWPRRVSPEAVIARLSPRPLLIIQGASDVRMSLEGARRLIGQAEEPKHLWVVEGAGHLASFAMNPTQYLSRLTEFFNKSLL